MCRVRLTSREATHLGTGSSASLPWPHWPWWERPKLWHRLVRVRVAVRARARARVRVRVRVRVWVRVKVRIRVRVTGWL